MEDGCFLLVSSSEERTLRDYLEGDGSDFLERIDLGSYVIYIYDYNIFS